MAPSGPPTSSITLAGQQQQQQYRCYSPHPSSPESCDDPDLDLDLRTDLEPMDLDLRSDLEPVVLDLNMDPAPAPLTSPPPGLHTHPGLHPCLPPHPRVSGPGPPLLEPALTRAQQQQQLQPPLLQPAHTGAQLQRQLQPARPQPPRVGAPLQPLHHQHHQLQPGRLPHQPPPLVQQLQRVAPPRAARPRSPSPSPQLPPLSQLDPSVLDALPLTYKRQLESAYGAGG